MTGRELPERTATAAELAAERAKTSRARHGASGADVAAAMAANEHGAEALAADEPLDIRNARESIADYRELMTPSTTGAEDWYTRIASNHGKVVADLEALIRAWERGEFRG